MADFKPQSGKTYPLGSFYDGKGVNFALFSAHAEKVELCLFDKNANHELNRFPIVENDNNIWHIYIPNLKPGQVYGYRVYGPYNPTGGQRFNPNKLLLDPYAKKITGKLIWHKAIFGYDTDSPDKDLSFSKLDSAPYVPKSVVIEDKFDWQNDQAPDIPFNQTVIYETHIKGYTKLHPQIAPALRGKIAAMGEPAVINYLKWLGITAVELLPIQAFHIDKQSAGEQKENYWGYETLNYFAPEPNYLLNADINEFKTMVRRFHSAGIEVLLDVVYNHTAEGNQMGPTICYRGIDNQSYYVLNKENPRYYYDSTGCGASLNAENHYVVRLIMDSLRYWVKDMHVDGFRFDLATTLSRSGEKFTQNSGFLYAVRQDETLQKVKLIAEPWDVGIGGYQLGAFPARWGEWNDRYRDVVRRFWKGDKYQTAEMASRISGSSDIFNYNNRDIVSSINFVTAHDGFCLNDLTRYNFKHNTANGEDNRDGSNSNWSWNSGAEGESGDTNINENRQIRQRAMLATLLLSFGTPMLLGGDEFLHTRMGNNNPYCQDNIISWLAWEAIDKKDRAFVRYVKKLLLLRKELRIFRRRHFFTGVPNNAGIKDLNWYTEGGREFTNNDWSDGERKSLSYCVRDDDRFILCILNACNKDMNWKLPSLPYSNWHLLLDSSQHFATKQKIHSGGEITAPAWGILLFEITK